MSPDQEPMLPETSENSQSEPRTFLRWRLPALGTATLLVAAILWARQAPGALVGRQDAVISEYSSGYKEGHKYNICSLDLKKCFAHEAEHDEIRLVDMQHKASHFSLHGEQTHFAVLKGGALHCAQIPSSGAPALPLGSCSNAQRFELPPLNMLGQIRLSADPQLCLQAVDQDGASVVKSAPCGLLGTTWAVGEDVPQYKPGIAYKVCNPATNLCISNCRGKGDQKICGFDNAGTHMTEPSEAAGFLLRRPPRTDQDVTTLELADQSKGRFCLQVQNLSMAWGSPLRFEPCQRTRQNFYLPMPAESSRKIRWALSGDECLELRDGNVKTSRCLWGRRMTDEQRWKLVSSEQGAMLGPL